jgi:diguanylate cyclase (GGDEF)-like protein/PAS domain S-box-containing protein
VTIVSIWVPAAYDFSPYAVPTAAVTVLMLLLGTRVAMRRLSRVSVSFFGMTLVVAVWQCAFTFMYLATDSGTALVWARMAYLGVPFIAPAIYQFTIEMLRIRKRRRIAATAAWLVSLAWSAVALFSNGLVADVHRFWWGFYPQYGRFSIPFLAFFFGYLVAALAEFVVAFPNARGTERKRIRLLLVAFGIAYVGCVDYLAKYGLPVYPFGYVPILGFILVVAHTMRRYDLVPITPSLAANEIISTMAEALFVCDAEGQVQFANRAAETLLGYESSEIVGRHIEDFLVRDDRFSRSFRRLSVRNSEHIFLARNGERIDMMLSIAPVVHHGEAAGAVIIARDMREKKKADAEIRKAVTLLHSTLDSTTDGIIAIGDGGRILTHNQRFLEMWRIPATMIATGDERLVITSVLDQLSDPDEFLRATDSLYAQPDAESVSTIEFRDGRRFERYSIGRRIEGVGNVRVSSFRDVTARYAAEVAMRESELRYRLLFEQNAAGVCVTNVAGTVLDCNDTFASMLGSTRPEVLGVNLDTLHARQHERGELIAMLRDAKSLNSIEVELLRRGGGRIWVLQNMIMVGLGDEAVIHSTFVDISDRKRAEEQIEFHAYHDVLTGLPNRKLFTDRLTLSLTRSRRSGRSLAVMFIDLDHFKTINDRLGHTAGDELLIEMSRRLKNCIRDDDTVARLGGDEFTIILSELRHPEDAANVAEKILDAVQMPLSISSVPIEVTASIGIALYPNDGADAESLLRNADSAMYRAKESGRNNYQLCTDEMKRRALERLSLESRLRRALYEDQLLLQYQPQISLVTGRIIGAEALVRWNDPERGLVEPSGFIPFAEESRLIVPLGEWVLRTACKQTREWQRHGRGPGRIAVNLSARQFQQHDLVDMVGRILKDVGLDPGTLELEITETTAMQDGEVTIEVLRSLREIGVATSIDDFGTGYSSLNYLRRFPINAVKIDREFVRDLATDEGDAAIVSAVIGMARNLGFRVVAEGVETQQQYAFLQRRQCDEAQGYFFGYPVAPEVLGRALDEQAQAGRTALGHIL